MKTIWARRRAIVILLAILTACASYPPGDPHLLTFLQDGVTTWEDVYMKLAEPSAVWEDGRILTYQLDHNHQGYVPMRRREAAWSAKYSLVLSFDKQGILRRHSLVRMKDDPVVP